MSSQVNDQRFWKWLVQHSSTLLELPELEIVELVTTELHSFDADLFAEVSGILIPRYRNLVITSHGRTEKFDRIIRMVSNSPSIPNWNLVALKPARGFDFCRDEMELAIRDWRFVTLKRDARFSSIGLRVEMSQHDLDLVDGQIVSDIVEEGIGEVLLSAVSHLEFGVFGSMKSFSGNEIGEAIRSWCVLRGPKWMSKYLTYV